MSDSAGARDPAALETRTGSGLSVLVTRSRKQASRLSAKLAAEGARVTEVPVIDIVPEHSAAFDRACHELGGYDRVVFTSPNAVGAVAAARARSAACGPVPVAAAVGPATARAAEGAGFEVSCVPTSRYVAESLVDALTESGVAGQRVFYPRAASARTVVEEGLRAAGADVDVVVAYHALPRAGAGDELRAALEDGIDIITVASSNTARYLARVAAAAGVSDRLAACPFASIGPITSATVRELGFELAAEAEPSTLDGLVAAVLRWHDR